MSSSLRFIFLFVLSTAIGCAAEPLTFQRAIQLATTHAPAMGIAAADQVKAQESYLEARNVYLPNVVFGSGLGYSYGYPLSLEGSAPSIFNVNYQSALFNFAQRDFIRSAKLEWTAAGTNKDDQRKEVILDTALTYIQLDNQLAQLKVLQQQEKEATELQNITAQRVQQGVDSQMTLTQAKLSSARVRLRIAELEGSVDVLRQKMGQLTGLPAADIVTVTESVPALPEVNQQEDMASVAVSNNESVKVAQQRADASSLRARGEHRALYPTFDLVAQYGLFSTFNNYERFFQPGAFQRNNATMGVAIRVPFLNFTQRAHADAADADALKAHKQVEAVKNQVSAETLKLQRTVRQLAAAQQVAQLEYQLAQAQAEATQIRVENGAPAPSNPEAQGLANAPASPRDLANARLLVNDKYSQYLDTSFELDKARLQLLRATGELEKWASPRQP